MSTSSAWSTLKLAVFCRGGKSRKAWMNFATKDCAGTMKKVAVR